MPPSQVLARDGRSNSPIMTVASIATRMPALISDARTGSKCGGHIAERLTAHPQLGKTGWPQKDDTCRDNRRRLRG